MFYSLTGTVVHIDEYGAAIECGGVAFYCASSMNTLKKIGETGAKVTLFTYLNVREDALDLFGFSDRQELDCFKLLIGVTGVGPKAALAILSQFTPERLSFVIASGDAKSITKAQGVGTKIAQRVVLELKGKLSLGGSSFSGFNSDVGIASASSNCEEAVSALEMLGYSRADASVAVAKLDSALPTEELIKHALKTMAKF